MRNAFAIEMQSDRRHLVLKGCRFHYGQAIDRNMKKYLRKLFDDDDSIFRNWRKSILGLPILPTRYVRRIWRVLSQQKFDSTFEQQRLAFFKYFENEWLRSDDYIELWNHFDNPLCKTTNPAEGYHSGIKSSCPGINPTEENYIAWLTTVSDNLLS